MLTVPDIPYNNVQSSKWFYSYGKGEIILGSALGIPRTRQYFALSLPCFPAEWLAQTYSFCSGPRGGWFLTEWEKPCLCSFCSSQKARGRPLGCRMYSNIPFLPVTTNPFLMARGAVRFCWLERHLIPGFPMTCKTQPQRRYSALM